MKLTEQEIEALERGIAEDKSRISYLEQRVKALEDALTPSAETKAAFMGEFSIHFEYIDRDGEEIFYIDIPEWD